MQGGLQILWRSFLLAGFLGKKFPIAIYYAIATFEAYRCIQKYRFISLLALYEAP